MTKTFIPRALTAVAAASMAIAVVPAVASATTSCSTALRLFTGTSYTGTSYSFSARGVWIDLPVGIDNASSSFKMGACSATFKDTVYGSVYPGSTVANTWSSSMSAGWDNRISAIYIA
jgi:hypothetical protein